MAYNEEAVEREIRKDRRVKGKEARAKFQPGKTIIARADTTYGEAYKIEPTDTPWFAVPVRNLRAA